MENAPFFLITILVLATFILIFGMKYFSKGHAAKTNMDRDASYKSMSEKYEQTQSSLAQNLELIRSDIEDLKARTKTIETMLKEVG